MEQGGKVGKNPISYLGWEYSWDSMRTTSHCPEESRNQLSFQAEDITFKVFLNMPVFFPNCSKPSFV